MSNTERFYPAPPAPGSAPVPAPTDSPSASRQRVGVPEVAESSAPASGVFAPHPASASRDPWDDLSELERSFLALPSEEPTPRLLMGGAALAEMEAAAVAQRPQPPASPTVDAVRSREERLRDTAPARRDIVVVRKRAATPDGFELAAPAQKPSGARAARSKIWQRALPWIAALGVVGSGAVLQLVRGIRAAIPSSEVESRASQPSKRSTARLSSSATPSVAAGSEAEIMAQVELPERPASVSSPNTDTPVSALAPSAEAQNSAEPASEPTPPVDKLKQRSVGGVSSNNAPVRAFPPRRPSTPSKKSSWLDTPISPPED